MKKSMLPIPTFDSMMLPTLQASQILGGSGTVDEIYGKVIELLSLPNEVLEIPHGDTSYSEVEYRLAWSRTYLKKYGLIDNSSSKRGVWSLNSTDIDLNKFDPKRVIKAVREANKAKPAEIAIATPLLPMEVEDVEAEEEILAWHQLLHKILINLTPAAFERLAQRLLRESGFIHVEVTGKSGDGGIDGIGIARVAGFLSFHVLFQCKRYQGAITPSQIRDFRGAMQGRTDKGLFITTGTFTREAVKEATRDGAPPIDLIDGEQLVKQLKELGLGVKIKMVESIEVDTEWFTKI
ncbi:MAG TPA: restriction endonuclease [Chthonomonadaceae bacterium]|nr:restriction endonuclease [Chthonomonadaceae bacterium]